VSERRCLQTTGSGALLINYDQQSDIADTVTDHIIPLTSLSYIQSSAGFTWSSVF